MKIYEIICENTSHSDAETMIKKFIDFAKAELKLKSLPEITLYTNSNHSTKYSSFGGYGNHSIMITISNRHPVDVMRTLAHELVHYKQDLDNKLNQDSGRDGSPEENEANAMAAVIMRKWGKRHPNLFSTRAIE
jgi:hypothetical protein